MMIILVNRRMVVEPPTPSAFPRPSTTYEQITSWSSSSCEIHERRGRPTGRIQPLFGLIPLRLSKLSRTVTFADVLGSSLWLPPVPYNTECPVF